MTATYQNGDVSISKTSQVDGTWLVIADIHVALSVSSEELHLEICFRDLRFLILFMILKDISHGKACLTITSTTRRNTA